MRCPKCQAENPDEAEFCSLCYMRFRTEDYIDGSEKNIMLRENHPSSRIRCPNCGTLSPVQSPFCLSCGFTFDDIEGMLVSEEEAEALAKEKDSARRREREAEAGTPITVDEGSEGAEVMRRLEGVLDKGEKAIIHTKGRNAITHAMKIIALLSDDLYKLGKSLSLRVNLLSEGTVTHLDEVELEIILDTNEV